MTTLITGNLQQQDTALRILRAHGATDVERTAGNIIAGEWIDFDALMPLRLASA